MSAATELRHITSNPALVSVRHSQHLHAHSPVRSPTSISIPSSPTSVHSSSSAIFERDIEPLSPASPLTHIASPANAHRIPRSKTTETIEHSVPSVLDSAAAILTSIQNANDVAVVAPAPYSHSFAGSGFASPIGSFRSRSPSPTIANFSSQTQGRNSLLLNIPQQQQQSHHIPAAARPASIQTSHVSPAPPAIVTPTSAYFSAADDESPSADSSHETTRIAIDPSTTAGSAPGLAAAAPSTFSQPHSPGSVTASPSTLSKRLSFVSYTDLLTSTPTSTIPLSSLTSAASAFEPPPHISGVAYPATASAATSLRGFPMGYDAPGSGSHSGSPKRARDAQMLLAPGHPATLDDVGGEWEREGLGRGLAERLDVLYGTAHT
ncbi:hypothetical protein C0993_009317 [Termitomyces sp. T159_Od127]|nr:hypothetical protein C0993_009317 [Termitomyces sp. T159_Od127]